MWDLGFLVITMNFYAQIQQRSVVILGTKSGFIPMILWNGFESRMGVCMIGFIIIRSFSIYAGNAWSLCLIGINRFCTRTYRIKMDAGCTEVLNVVLCCTGVNDDLCCAVKLAHWAFLVVWVWT